MKKNSSSGLSWSHGMAGVHISVEAVAVVPEEASVDLVRPNHVIAAVPLRNDASQRHDDVKPAVTVIVASGS